MILERWLARLYTSFKSRIVPDTGVTVINPFEPTA
ncbi:hypothetical protein HD593_003629 [Nonomuraea rubra]|uniref:Uncharacterized protein n=1 Tax=Nonomuraea rubra TaxID=46180 RepID=A0A7X0TZ21_9ACTN|nr:hypothetical protein [Nonomuraea rubra]